MPDLVASRARRRSDFGSSLPPWRRPVRGAGDGWFGPQNPLAPIAPPDVAGRQFDYPPGYNLVTRPRAYEPIGFFELRALADCYDLLRIIIETRKDQIARLGWSVKPRRQRVAVVNDPRIARIEAFFARPDGANAWDAWLRQLLEDLFVIDAPTLWAERTRGGDLLRLHPIDGATIKRVIDQWGRTPLPPYPAYQQVLHGLPAVNYTARDILYRPRNPRVHKVYGFSPVEQIIVTVNIALRRQVYQLQYYTEGNVPEALIGAPDAWMPEQIERFQLYWDALNAGNTAQRRHAKFVPGGVAKTFIPTREVELTGATDEWLARLCCFAFSVSPQPFVRMMNRATAETAQDQALDEGLAPIRQWVKHLVDDIIAEEFAARPISSSAGRTTAPAIPAKAASIATDYVKAGIKSVNEVRAELGLGPVAGGELPLVMTAQGPVRLGVQPTGQQREPLARYNENHYGPGPQGGQFAPAGEDGAAGASSRSQQIAQDESEEAKAARNLPFVAKAEAIAAARNPAAAASELQRILQQNPADYANARATFLQSALPNVTSGKTTVAIGVAEDAQGNRYVLVATNELGNQGLSYLRSPVNNLVQPNETRVPAIRFASGDMQHAEINLLEYATANDVKLIAVGAGRPYCADCGPALDAAGVLATGPRRR